MFEYRDEIKNFLDGQGRLTGYPSKYKRQIFALFYLASKFERGKRYTEKEVNQLLKDWHTFEDWAMLRRDLCDHGFLRRERDGSMYWPAEDQPTLEAFGWARA